MELRQLIKFFNKNRYKIATSVIVMGLVGALTFYIIPKTYTASGSLFIGRSLQPLSQDFFTYEGYYGQQAASAYTASVTGLIESEDVGAKVIQQNNSEITNKALRNYKKAIRVKNTGPQVITVYIKERSQEKATELWKNVTNTTIELTNHLSKSGDSAIEVQKVSNDPVVTEDFSHILLNTLAGALLGFIISTTVLSFKEYLL